MKAQCGDCEFFYSGDASKACHRNPPLTFLLPPRTELQGPSVMSYWPPTKEDNWCGEYVQKMVLT